MGVDTTLEVTVSGENSAGNQIVVDDTVLNLVGNLTRVADAGHATVASGLEAECIKSLLYSSSLVVLCDDVGAGGQRSLEVGAHREALGNSVLGEKTSLEHDIGVASVGA